MDTGLRAFDEVPLSALLPRLSAADIASMQRVARSLGVARSGVTVKGWDWWPESAVFKGPRSRTSVILSLCVVQPSADDWLEFAFDVGWTEQGRHLVSVKVWVGCFCETDHGGHDAVTDALTLAVGDGISLPDAFAACAERMAGWLAEPRDADFWRARTDAPPRPG